MLYNVWLLITILATIDLVSKYGQVTLCDLITSLIKFHNNSDLLHKTIVKDNKNY